MTKKHDRNNNLATGNISSLMMQFAIPSIIAMLVSSIYNIVDQLFIGNAVGTLGNAATNIAFPVTTLCIAVCLLFGIGGAAGFNLSLGAGEKETAPYYFGNAITMLLSSGIIICIFTELFLDQILLFCGSPLDVLPYAKQYVSVTAIGIPFLIIVGGGGHLIRADGSPKMTMICSITGAIINTVLDAIFVLGFHWGMYGAAAATVIGQFISAMIVLKYLRHCKTFQLERKHLIPQGELILKIASLGMANGFNQIAMMIVQIVSNNLLKKYGAMSPYGETIPIACAGIVAKVSMLYFSIVIGLSQGAQPIESFNYGAQQYKRVRDTYFLAIKLGAVVSIVAFAIFQIFPRQLLALFGNGSELYFEFGIRYIRIFLFFCWINEMQPITSNFFASIGKAYKGLFLSLTRQVIFLLPLMFLLPNIMGIDGILYAGAIADLLAFSVALCMVIVEMRNIKALEMQEDI